MNFWFAEFGQILLIATFVWAVFGIFLQNLNAWSRVQFLLLSGAISFLAISFVLNDFSISYIYQNSHTLLPWYYRICAVWGAHEGSWLLWSWLLGLFTLIVMSSIKELPESYRKAVERNIAVVMASFTGFMLFTSNPFLRSIPLNLIEGRDLNPLLQDPGMILHPPLLYSGYVGFVLVFAMALAAVQQQEYSEIWQKSAAKLAKIAWFFLTLGIVLGSWWAYRELGWGGFWGWDPVENASLLPWLTGTALVHLLIEKYNSSRILLFVFSALCFFLSILGTFLLRSGLVISVHAFAQDPSRGLVLLGIMASIISVCTYLLYINRAKFINLKPFIGHEKLIQAQSLLFVFAAITVLLGTMYPLISQVLWHENLSVGAPYFNKMLLPNLIMALILMALPVRDVLLKKRLLFLMFVILLVIGYGLFQDFSLKLLLLVLVLSLLAINIVGFWRRRSSFLISHLGFMVMLIGVIVTSSFTSSNVSYIKVGEIVQLGQNTKIKLNKVEKLVAKHYDSYIASFDVNGANLTSEERFYRQRAMILPKVGIISTIFGSDIYLAFGHSEDSWVLRSYYRPLVRWIWFGGIMMALGAIMTFWERKK